MADKFEKCRFCGRKLRSEKSKLLGYGKGCYEKYLGQKEKEMSNRNSLLNIHTRVGDDK